MAHYNKMYISLHTVKLLILNMEKRPLTAQNK